MTFHPDTPRSEPDMIDSPRAHFWLSLGLIAAIGLVVWGPVLARLM